MLHPIFCVVLTANYLVPQTREEAATNMNKTVVGVLCWTALCCHNAPVNSTPVNNPDIVIVVNRARIAPRIDGELDDPAWDTASMTELTWTETGARVPRNFLTQVAVVHDDKALYVAFRNHDPATHDLRTDITEHDKCLVGDDAVAIFLEPHGTGEGHSFRVAVNAGNTVRDVWRPSETNLESSRLGKIPQELIPIAMAYVDVRDWEPKDVESAIRIEDDCWTVEISIPFEDMLEFRPKNSRWGVNFVRRIVGMESFYATWTNGGRKFMRPQRFGRLLFND